MRLSWSEQQNYPMSTFVEMPSLTYEKERGKPMPSLNHSIVQVRLILEFSRTTELIFSELSLELSFGKTRVPDLSIFKNRIVDFRHDEVTVSDPPETVVEIFSPRQASEDVMSKLDEYFAFGIKTVWVVSPPLRHVTIFAADGTEARFTEGIATDPVTGLTADLTKIFRPLGLV